METRPIFSISLGGINVGNGRIRMEVGKQFGFSLSVSVSGISERDQSVSSNQKSTFSLKLVSTKKTV